MALNHIAWTSSVCGHSGPHCKGSVSCGSWCQFVHCYPAAFEWWILKKKKKIKIPCYWNSIHDISPNISVTNDEVFGSNKGFRWNLFSPYPHLEARWRGVSPLLFWAFISIQVLTLSANSKAFTHCQNTSKCICHWVTKLSTCHFALQSPSFHMSKSALQVNIVIKIVCS